MKTFWKVLGAAALVVGLTPYKVEKNEETGENSYQALLWRITSAPGEGEDKREININLGEGTLTSKLLGGAAPVEEPHLFSDELCVEYTGTPVTLEETVETPAEDTPIETTEAEAPVVEEVPADPTPAEETKEED